MYMDEQQTHNNDTNTPENVSTSGVEQEMGEHKKQSNRMILWVIIVVMVIIGAAAIFWFYVADEGNRAALLMNDAAGNDAVVATVNGTDILQSDLAQSMPQAEQAVAQQGVDLESPEAEGFVQEQALSVVINTLLLIQAAEASGVTASEDEVATQISAIETQLGGAEAFAAQVASLGLTDEQVRNDIREQLLIDAYLQQTDEFSQVAVTEEEVASFYETLQQQNGDALPSFETIAPQIEQQLLFQKQQQAVLEIINRLRDEADIEILI